MIRADPPPNPSEVVSAIPSASTREKLPSDWAISATLRGGFGYADNILLASADEQSSAFAVGGADLVVLWEPPTPNSLSLFLSGDDRIYFDPASVPGSSIVARRDQLAFARIAYKWHQPSWDADIVSGYQFNHQVFDASDLDGRGAIRARGHQINVTPGLIVRPLSKLRVEAQATGQRQIYELPVSSYWEWGPRVVVGWDYGLQRFIESGSGFGCRPYDDRQRADLGGNRLAGTRLATLDWRSDLTWKHSWDSAQQWSTTLRGSYLQRDDGGSGYFDFHRVGALASVRYLQGPWTVRFTGRWWDYGYEVQLVSPSNPVPRQRQEWQSELRIEYLVGRHARWFGQFEWEKSKANSVT